MLCCRREWHAAAARRRSCARLAMQRCNARPATVLSCGMPLPRMPQAVVFDMDGLLFDTETLYVEAAITAAAELGHEASTELILRTTGGPWPQTRQLLLEHYGEAFPADHFVTVWIRHFRVLAEDRLALKPGVIELLDLLDRLGLPKAIATSSSHPTVQRHLAAFDLTGRFDAIAAAGD